MLLGGGAAAFALSTSGGNNGGSNNNGNGGHSVVALKPPGCSVATGPGKRLPNTPLVSVPNSTGNPFGIASSADGKAVFVVTDTSVQVFRVGADGTPTAAGFGYPISGSSKGQAATSAQLTHDGKYLLVAFNDGIQIFDAQAAEAGQSSAFVGSLSVPGLTKYGRAVGIAVTPDDKYVFVSLQFADQIGVFNLANAVQTHDFSSSQYLGSLNAGTQPVGLAVSPDGKTLYATNFVQDSPVVPGQLTVFDVKKATTKGDQKGAEVSQVNAGCNPARIAVTADGKSVWITTRQSNEVLGYSAALLRTSPGKALHARIRVGQTPIGIVAGQGRLEADYHRQRRQAHLQRGPQPGRGRPERCAQGQARLARLHRERRVATGDDGVSERSVPVRRRSRLSAGAGR